MCLGTINYLVDMINLGGNKAYDSSAFKPLHYLPVSALSFIPHKRYDKITCSYAITLPIYSRMASQTQTGLEKMQSGDLLLLSLERGTLDERASLAHLARLDDSYSEAIKEAHTQHRLRFQELKDEYEKRNIQGLAEHDKWTKELYQKLGSAEYLVALWYMWYEWTYRNITDEPKPFQSPTKLLTLGSFKHNLVHADWKTRNNEYAAISAVFWEVWRCGDAIYVPLGRFNNGSPDNDPNDCWLAVRLGMEGLPGHYAKIFSDKSAEGKFWPDPIVRHLKYRPDSTATNDSTQTEEEVDLLPLGHIVRCHAAGNSDSDQPPYLTKNYWPEITGYALAWRISDTTKASGDVNTSSELSISDDPSKRFYFVRGHDGTEPPSDDEGEDGSLPYIEKEYKPGVSRLCNVCEEELPHSDYGFTVARVESPHGMDLLTSPVRIRESNDHYQENSLRPGKFNRSDDHIHLQIISSSMPAVFTAAAHPRPSKAKVQYEVAERGKK
ncbi:hypothetical protein F4777DRAFT_407988 [Nemania sp. FL0916]|nr:hypothetical protein F4777DRAFT_407988 [Nemania sp. FL0916]